ncbi:MAG TPA: ATP-binding protein [Blastocatellia bacterium]|nr:ATP-binding protein [Blastocatellia bacterium]
MTDILTGTVKGPGEKPNEFLFITADNRHTRIGEFVYYNVPLEQQSHDGSELRIIGTITDRRLIRNLPDSFLADPNTPPGLVSALIGLGEEDGELYEITVSSIGYFDQRLSDFINPRIPPTPGQPVYLASSENLARMLSPKNKNDRGAAHIGSLLTRSEGEVPIVLSVRDVVSTHLAILASTGAGKSYVAGVLTEELMMPNNRAAVLVVDPHGEYDTLREIESHPAFTDGSYRPAVKIFQPDKVKVRFDSLELADIRYLLPELTDKMNFNLTEAFRNLKSQKATSEHYTLDDFMDSLQQQMYEGKGKDNSGSNVGTIEALMWRLNYRFRQSKIFSNSEHNALDQLFMPGQVTVLQLNDIDQQEQQVIVGTLLRRVNAARMSTERKEITDPTNERYLPYPVFILIEEAHRFAPAGATVVSTNVLKQILSEGRKFGVGIGLITQRPGKLDQDVLSQCMTQFIMRIVNPIDQQTIASSVEGVGRKMLDELPALTKGQVVVSGVAINTPVMCRVRTRITKHGGQTIDAPEKWSEWHSNRNASERERETAVLRRSEGKKGQRIGGIDV